MKKNMGLADRFIRIGVAIAAAVLYVTEITTGALGITLVAAGGVLALTAFVSFCPIYAVIGAKTCRTEVR